MKIQALVTTCIAILASTSLARASVYVVDDNGGVGVDFTDMPAAVAAAVAGDVLLVRAGTYHGFTLSTGVTILADAGVSMLAFPLAAVQVTNVPAGQRAVLSGLQVTYVDVIGCGGRILLEGLGTAYTTTPVRPGLVTIQGSSDVRLRACNPLCVSADASRVEITGSTLLGLTGNDGCQGTECQGSGFTIQGGTGFAGLTAKNGAVVHVGATNMTGGTGGLGGYLDFMCPTGNGGNGGAGARTASGGSIFITGTNSETITGGTGGQGDIGIGCPPGFAGQNGPALDATGGAILYSKVALVGAITGSSTQSVPGDPCLTTTGSGIPATQIVYTVHGEPGDEARLRLGRQFTIEDLQFVFEDRLMISLRSYNLGVIPASGHLSFTLNVPTILPKGYVILAQGTTTTPLGETRLTQSAPFAIR